MKQKIIRSHRARVKQAKDTIKNNPRYSGENISIFDREAFVEFYLLEDIVKLYHIRLKQEQNYVAQGRADERGKKSNIEKFSAIINVFNAAIGAARAAINSGDYKRVWKAIPEKQLTKASNSIKNLPKLRELAIDMLRELLDDTLAAVKTSKLIDDSLDELDIHENNSRKVYDLPMTSEEIEEVIRVAENLIPNLNKKSILDKNIQ